MKLPKPSCIGINLTNKCNQHCIYCEIGQGMVKTGKPLLTLDDLKWIIDQMHQAEIPTLVLGGGEPFLFRDIFETIQYAYKVNVKCSILTNGMLLTTLPQDKINLLKECKTHIKVSIDSFSDDSQERIRGVKNALSLSRDGIRRMVEHKIPVSLATAISVYNYKDLFDVVTNAKKMGVSDVAFQPIVHISNFPEVAPIKNKKDLNVLPEHLGEIKDQFRRIMAIEKENQIKTNVSVLRHWLAKYIKSVSSAVADDFFFNRLVNRLWCVSLYSEIIINYYGDILPCNMLKPVKSIKDRAGKSLLELWNESCESTRLMFKKRQYPRECRSCVCDFAFNLAGSVRKYPFSNFRMLCIWIAKKLKLL
jgi:MoaA/NifB/PqqE/SkfB family radical SAM enzyme